MDLFSNAKAVRLRSHHDKYLSADDDEEGVTQDRNASSRNARWAVELVSGSRLRLKSRYGKYLTASDEAFLLGIAGSKVLQSLPRRQQDSSVEWEPIREGKRVKLRSRHGDFLRANGGLPPWRNSITHDHPHRTSSQDWVLWDVDIVDILPTPTPTPDPSSNYHHNRKIKAHQVAHLGPRPDPPPPLAPPPPKVNAYQRQESYGYTPPRSEGRVIYYHIAEEDGKVNEEDGQGYPLTFKGNSVEELTVRLMEDTGIKDIVVCTRSPLNGKLYPLHLQLPPNSVSMHVVVVPSSSIAASS